MSRDLARASSGTQVLSAPPPTPRIMIILDRVTHGFDSSTAAADELNPCESSIRSMNSAMVEFAWIFTLAGGPTSGLSSIYAPISQAPHIYHASGGTLDSWSLAYGLYPTGDARACL